MLIELNGLSFHVEILPGSKAAGPRARIIDEAFRLPPMDRRVVGVDCVMDLIEQYTGLERDDEMRRQVTDLMAVQTAPARREFRVETGSEPHVLFLMN